MLGTRLRHLDAVVTQTTVVGRSGRSVKPTVGAGLSRGSPGKMCMNKGLINLPSLTPQGQPVTLTGGTEGKTQNAKHPLASSAAASQAVSSAHTELIRTAHSALSAMVAGFLGQDRELLDSGFEDLVGCIEEMRDAVPKVPA